MKVLKFFVLIVSIFALTFAANEFTLSSWRNCPGNLSMKFSPDLHITSVSNKFFFDGILEVNREVHGPLELVMDMNKCDADMKKCEKNPPTRFKELCQKLNDKRAFYYSVLETLEPKLECPFKAQEYKAANSSVDFTPFTLLPVNGYIWAVTLKIVSGSDKKRVVEFCAEINLKIVRSNRRRRPKQN